MGTREELAALRAEPRGTGGGRHGAAISSPTTAGQQIQLGRHGDAPTDRTEEDHS
ncbi:hypothetical protein ACH9EU_09195 [Kocuria sp. M1R5S2]|uniref:hypothetical protein n=1 Tax=Kocuria rhizosphaerae TaxID=3376285 RepID=UPI0037B8A536